MRIEGQAPGGRSNLERGSRTERNHGALPPRNSVGYGVCRSECRSRHFGAAPQALASACRRGRRLRSQRRESTMSTLRASATMKVFLLAPFWPFNPLAIPALRIFGVFGGRFRSSPAGDFDAKRHPLAKDARCPPRRIGLLRCGHCGRMLKVQHNGLRDVVRYLCNDATSTMPLRRSASRSATCASTRRSRPRCCVRSPPLALDAAFPAIADHERASVECVRHPELALEQESYEGARARRQYDAVKSGEPTGRR